MLMQLSGACNEPPASNQGTASARYSSTGAGAKVGCLLIHAEASLCLPLIRHHRALALLTVSMWLQQTAAVIVFRHHGHDIALADIARHVVQRSHCEPLFLELIVIL